MLNRGAPRLLRDLRVTLPICTAAAFLWFFVFMSPWRSFLHSDHSVPFEMTMEPWRAYDLYYWGTSRMGMLYEIGWKLLTHPYAGMSELAGSRLNTELFYFFHLLFYFLGIGFWLATFDTLLTATIFLFFAIPINEVWTEYFLLPGQPYGFLFFLSSLFFFTLKSKESSRRELLLGLLIAALWIQHELSGAIAFLIYLASAPWPRKSPLRWQYWSVFAPLLAVAYFFKIQSEKASPLLPNHYGLVTSAELRTNLHVLMLHGFQIHDTRYFGWPLMILLIACTSVILKKCFGQKTLSDEKVIAATLLGTLGCFVLVNLSHWYYLSGGDPRYYLNLIPLTVWGLLRFFETQPQARLRMIIPVALLVGIVNIQLPQKWIYPHQSTDTVGAVNDLRFQEIARQCLDFDIKMDSSLCRMIRMKTADRLAEQLEAEGCTGFIGSYWATHILSSISDGKIRTISSGADNRNPALFDEIIHSPHFCLADSRDAAHYKCESRPGHFFVCSPEPKLSSR
jgi:hypothetical protein